MVALELLILVLSYTNQSLSNILRFWMQILLSTFFKSRVGVLRCAFLQYDLLFSTYFDHSIPRQPKNTMSLTLETSLICILSSASRDGHFD